MNHENPASASSPRLIWLILRLHHHRTEVGGMHGCHSWSRYSSLAQGQALKLPEPVLGDLSLSLLEDRALGLELRGKRKASAKASKQNNKPSNKARLQHLAPLALRMTRYRRKLPDSCATCHTSASLNYHPQHSALKCRHNSGTSSQRHSGKYSLQRLCRHEHGMELRCDSFIMTSKPQKFERGLS